MNPWRLPICRFHPVDQRAASLGGREAANSATVEKPEIPCAESSGSGLRKRRWSVRRVCSVRRTVQACQEQLLKRTQEPRGAWMATVPGRRVAFRPR